MSKHGPGPPVNKTRDAEMYTSNCYSIGTPRLWDSDPENDKITFN